MLNAARSRKARSNAIAAATAAILPFCLPSQALAGTVSPAFAASAIANLASATNCRGGTSSVFTAAQTVGSAALVSKSRQKPMSALDRIRARQTGSAASLTLAEAQIVTYMPLSAAHAALASSGGFSEGAAPIVPSAAIGITCAYGYSAEAPRLPARNYDFLESRILPVSATAFDNAWTRVSHDSGGHGAARKAVFTAQADKGTMEDRIAKVNRWVNRRVTYTPDAKLYGKADHWAAASETLRQGKGDCEDYAIAKMEILAAMGVPRKDMYLTLARDLVRRDDHAVLIVKLDGRAILLDNASDGLIDGDRANDYRPIMSFSADQRFLHGY